MSSARVLGLYVYCANYHEGQGSRLYRLLSRIDRRYRPRLSDRAWRAIQGSEESDEWTDERAVYQTLEKAKFGQS